MRWHTSDSCTLIAPMRAYKPFLPLSNPGVPDAKPILMPIPHAGRYYFRIEYKCTAIGLKDGKLTLSNGRGNAPLVLDWPWETPKTVGIHWTGTQYEAIATYKVEAQAQPLGDKIAGIDLGEIHAAVSHDGERTHMLNGRLLRSKRQYQNKLKAKLQTRIDRCKKGSH